MPQGRDGPCGWQLSPRNRACDALRPAAGTGRVSASFSFCFCMFSLRFCLSRSQVSNGNIHSCEAIIHEVRSVITKALPPAARGPRPSVPASAPHFCTTCRRRRRDQASCGERRGGGGLCAIAVSGAAGRCEDASSCKEAAVSARWRGGGLGLERLELKAQTPWPRATAA